MSDDNTPKIPTREELVKHAGEKLNASLSDAGNPNHIAEEAKRKEAVDAASKVLDEALKAQLTGDKAKVGLTNEQAGDLAVAIREAQVAEPDAKEIQVAKGPMGALIPLADAIKNDIKDNAKESLQKTVDEAKTARGVYGNSAQALQTEVDRSVQLPEEAIQKKADEEKFEAAISALVKTQEALGKETAEAKRLAEATKDKHPEMQNAASGIVTALHGAARHRADFLDAKAAYDKLEADAKKGQDAPKDEAAKEAEAKAEQAMKDAKEKFKGKDEEAALARFVQAQIDRQRESDPAFKENLDKTKGKLNVGKDLSAMVATDSITKDTGGVVKTDVTREGGAQSDGMGVAGRLTTGVLGAAALGLVAKAAMDSSKPGEVNPETGEQAPKKGMSVMGKIAVTIGAVIGVAAIGMALRGGSPSKGWQDAADAGKPIMGKFTQALHSSYKLGQYGGITK